ncbi:hypothetical protein PG991_016283 [Apiospora marii]|uniref:Uncharacterized protein n=1 Tax=Apiospora marii TaxID=335849 RepID=A0ABR1QZM1_9PEZI
MVSAVFPLLAATFALLRATSAAPAPVAAAGPIKFSELLKQTCDGADLPEVERCRKSGRCAHGQGQECKKGEHHLRCCKSPSSPVSPSGKVILGTD